MPPFNLASNRPCRLRLALSGAHRFGGPPVHRGVTPPNTDTPLHLLLLLDLADANCPFKSDGTVRYLPLYYPLKYGVGGAEVQYAVLSDSDIEIFYLSEKRPDPESDEYVRVTELPSCSAEIVALCYEEARILAFAGGFFQPNAEDAGLLTELQREHPVILIGGRQRLPMNAPDVICRNAGCKFIQRRVWVEVIAAIPPVPVNGADDFWDEYRGADMNFYFCLCGYCGTIIAFNVCS
jgi:hypothetical protein